MGGLRSANARLREVVTSKDELSASKDTLTEAQRKQLGNYADTVRLHADRAQVQDQRAPSARSSSARRAGARPPASSAA